MAEIKVRQKRFVRAMKEARNIILPINIRGFYLFRLVQSWVFQGIGGAHWTEILFRICLELALVVGLSAVFSIWTHFPIMWAVLVAHTLMWTFNGHFWALKISENQRIVRNSPDRIKRYIEGLEQRLIQTEFITACILSGSLTSRKFHKYSDLDVWFTKNKGFFNGLWAYLLGVRERSIAFLKRIPIELYFYDPNNYTGKDAEETLVLLKDCGERWKMVEPGSISFKDYPLNEMEFFKAEKVK